MSYLLIAALTVAVGLPLAFLAGYLLGRLRTSVLTLQAENDALKTRVVELETNGDYPRRRTHADTRRLEDLLAVADKLRDDAELLTLWHEQDARLERERLDNLRNQLEKLNIRIGETRNSRPDQYPE